MTTGMFERRRMAARGAVVVMLAAVSAGLPARPAAQVAVPLAIRETVPEPATDTLTIVGEHFGTAVFVTLDLVPLEVRLAIDTRVVVAVPLGAMPRGAYLLTVSRGGASGESASVVVGVGGGPPAGPRPARPAPPPGTPAPAPSDVAAHVGDRVITVADVDREWQRTDPGTFAALAQQIYEHRRRVTDAMVSDELLAREAAARGVAREALLAEEVPRRRIPMPDSAVTSLFLSLGDRARGATLDQMRPALRAWLERNTEPELARMAYIEELMKTSTRVDVGLAAPRTPVERSARDPVLGPESAPIEIVAFGDLQSTDYVRLAQVFGRVRETFGDRVRIVFKPLPMFGAQSVPIAEAAACAHEQDRFWAYHDAAIKPGVLDEARLKAIVAQAGLERKRFDACIGGGAFRGQADAGLAEAERYGITRSPSVLVNGRQAPEPPAFLPPFEYLTRLIEEELQRQSRAAVKGGR